MLAVRAYSTIAGLLMAASLIGCGGSGKLAGDTSSASDTTTLAVEMTGESFPVNQPVVIVSGVPLNVSTVNTQTFYIVEVAEGSALANSGEYDPIVCDVAAAIPADVSCTDTYTCNLQTHSSLAAGTAYAICLTNDIKFSDGSSFGGATIIFVTEDPSHPQVVSVSPADNATDVAVSSTIQAEFSETMDASSINVDTFSLSGGIDGTFVINDKTVAFIPTTDLSAGTVYTVTISTGVKDSDGNSMTSEYSWSFTTIDNGGSVEAGGVNGGGDVNENHGIDVRSPFGCTSSMAVDSTFNNSAGYAYYDGVGDFDQANDTIVDGSGKIYMAGYVGYSNILNTGSDALVVRYNSDGTIDTSFGNSGVALGDGAADLVSVANSSDAATAITLDQSDRVLVAGSSTHTTYLDQVPVVDTVIAAWRFNIDGTLDTTFGGDGAIYLDRPCGNPAGGNISDSAYDISVDSNGKIYVAGNCTSDTLGMLMILARFNEDGSPDTTWGGGLGFVTSSGVIESAYNEYVRSMLIDTQGRILVSGSSDINVFGDYSVVVTENTIWRYNSDGTRDTSFGGGDGIVAAQNPLDSTWFVFPGFLTIDSQDRILLFSPIALDVDGNQFGVMLRRFNSDGSADLTFSSDGVLYSDAGNINSLYHGIVATDTNNDILVVALTTYENGDVAPITFRYRENGDVESCVGGGNGYVISSNTAPSYNTIGALLLDTSDRIVSVGSFNTETRMSDAFVTRFQ